jgi:hypothetical protein
MSIEEARKLVKQCIAEVWFVCIFLDGVGEWSEKTRHSCSYYLGTSKCNWTNNSRFFPTLFIFFNNLAPESILNKHAKFHNSLHRQRWHSWSWETRHRRPTLKHHQTTMAAMTRKVAMSHRRFSWFAKLKHLRETFTIYWTCSLKICVYLVLIKSFKCYYVYASLSLWLPYSIEY